ncbi:MAG: metallophosphoesterase [Fusobacteriales bacterium]|jgi:predicted MPP superfamily phosphohydrolase|nr:metallophosphoesterase [Fusobacteriales bacterium]
MKKINSRKRLKIRELIYLILGACIFTGLLFISMKNIFWFAGYTVLCISFVIYAVYENSTFHIKDLVIESDKISSDFENMKIIFFTDIQMDYFYTKNRKRIRKIVNFINREKPDVILFGGDYINKAGGTEAVFEELKLLKAEKGIYTVYGNHDYYDYKKITFRLKDLGIHILKNDSVKLVTENGTIIIAGIDDYLKGEPDIEKALENSGENFTVLLCHNPDYFEIMPKESKEKADITLSGHTHGGQLNLLGFVPFIPSRYGSKYRYGLKETEDGRIYISSGLGGVVFPMRFMAKPEIVNLILRKK